VSAQTLRVRLSITSSETTGPADLLAGIALALAAVSAVAGLVVPGLYRDSDAWIRQARAADLVTLLAVAPILAVAIWRARAGSAVGRLAVLAALGYLAYTYAIFGFSVAINPMTPVHVAVLGLSVWSLLYGVIELARHPLASDTGRGLPRRPAVALLLAVPVLFAAMWLAQIAQSIATGTPPAALAQAGLPTNPVYTLDLAFALPFLALAGVALARRSRFGGQLGLAASMWAALMGLGVLAIFAFDAAAGAPVEVGVFALIAGITFAATALALVAIVDPRRRSVASQAHPRA
jgi:hypothetical protein